MSHRAVISVWIVSPAHGRFAVTRLVLEQRRRLCRDLAVRGIDARMLITASDENLDLAREYGAVAVETPNRPLGRKCNIGLERAAREGADWIVWVGSDDWIHPDVFDPLPYQREGRERILIGQRVAIVDLATGMLMRCLSPSKYGAIPWIVPRGMLEPSRFRPVRPDLARGLDGALIRGIRLSRAPLDWHCLDPHDLRCVDFKSGVNITPFERLEGHATGPLEPAWSALVERYPADLVERARRIHLDFQEAPCRS